MVRGIGYNQMIMLNSHFGKTASLVCMSQLGSGVEQPALNEARSSAS